MIIEKVSLFNKDFCLKDNISVPIKITKVVNEIIKIKCPNIDEKKKKQRIKATKLVDEILYIIEDKTSFLFTTSMLFAGYDIDKISELVGVSKKAIEDFRDIFFNTTVFRGVLGKISFFKELLFSSDLEEQELGIVLKAVHVFGHEYIEWKFAIDINTLTTENIVRNTFKDMYFKYIEKSFSNNIDDVENHIRTGKQLISAAVDMQKATASNSSSSVSDIKDYLVELNDKAMSNSTWSSSFDVIDLDLENTKEDK